ncbi:MAG: fatty acid desaturase [Halioglobus sp.]
MQTATEQLRQPSNVLFLQVAAVYALVAVCVFLFSGLPLRLNGVFLLASVAAWAIIGWSQFALFNALHEGLHRRFGDPHRDRLCYALSAYPVGFDDSYRRVHLDHHKYFGDPARDPDYPNYGKFPVSRMDFLKQLALNLCGWYAILQFLGIRQGGTSEQEDVPSRAIVPIALAQILLLLLFSVLVGWFYYIWLWLIPLVTFGKFFSSTRAFCEHGSPDNSLTIRTITGSFLGEKVFGVFCFHYHAEHHEFVGVPYNQLQQVHQLEAEEMYTGSRVEGVRYEHFERGYFQLLHQWYKGLP